MHWSTVLHLYVSIDVCSMSSELFICMHYQCLQDSLAQQCQAVGKQKAASENRMVSSCMLIFMVLVCIVTLFVASALGSSTEHVFRFHPTLQVPMLYCSCIDFLCSDLELQELNNVL